MVLKKCGPKEKPFRDELFLMPLRRAWSKKDTSLASFNVVRIRELELDRKTPENAAKFTRSGKR